MDDVLVKYEPSAGNHYECDVCSEPIEEVYLLCKWDTEMREYYVSQIFCATHKSKY